MSSINFDNPYLLLLAIPIAALFIVPYAIAIRKDNLNGHNIASGVIHILMALIIAFVAAGTTIVTTVTETDVYVVADVSYSANKNLDTIDRYISDLGKSLPRNSKMGVVTFGKRYQLLTPLGGNVKSVKTNSEWVDQSATDIISALRYTGELFREDVIKRIVLITDGKQTSETDANALKRQVDALSERNIHVDAIYVDDNIKEDVREVQLSSVQVIPTTFLNIDATARITVNVSCEATTVDADGETVPYEVNTFIDVTRTKRGEGEEPIEYPTVTTGFTRGGNSYDLNLFTAEVGIYDYEVKIRVADDKEDENTLNNVISFTQEVAGKQKVLVVYKDEDDFEIIRDAYGANADVVRGYYLDTSEETGLKTAIEWINSFDEIVIANVDVRDINNYENFLRSLNTAVEMFGKSLITIGDTNIQNTAHGELDDLSKMLPVQFGSEGNEKLVTILVDTSRSMELNGRLARAKEAAKEIINMLEDSDTVSIVQFNGTPASVTSSKLEKGGKDKLKAIVDSLEVRQGTNIPAALEYVIPAASGGDYAEKQLMFISDGMNFSFDESASQSVRESVLQLLDRKVTTSVLDVGREGVSANAAQDALEMLTGMAANGSGNYMLINNANYEEVLKTQLPEGVKNNVGSTSEISINRDYDDVLDGLDTSRLTGGYSLVDKFIYANRRDEAVTVLTVDFIGASGNAITVPYYAYKDYGLGRTASLTSGLTSEWLYMNSALRSQLLSNIFATNVPERKISEPFIIDIEAGNGYAEVSLTPDRMYLDAVTSVEVTFDDGERVKQSTPVPLAGAGSKFTHTFITADEGKYTVKVTYKEREGAEEYTVERTVHVAYSAEYDSFALYDAGTLHNMIGARGTVSENGKLTIVNDASEVGLYNVSLNMPLLVACVVLFAVDIAVRKLKWEDIKSLFKRRKKDKKQ